MKGILILPKYLEEHWVPKKGVGGFDFSDVIGNNAPFFYSVGNALGFEIRYADEVDVPSGTDMVIMWGMPYHNRPKIVPGFFDIPENTKLVMFPSDIHCHGNAECLENKIKVFERSDLIIASSYEFFALLYPQFLAKFEFVPNCFSPFARYSQLPWNTEPRMQCLLSGAASPRVYPLRAFVQRNSRHVAYRPAVYRGDSYARLLNSYFCCFASSSIFNYVIAKYFEIPAAGSLLLADETSDLKRIGFVPGKHYVRVERKNALEKIAHCLEHPQEYQDIRREGMEYVRRNHSVLNRVARLESMLKELVR